MRLIGPEDLRDFRCLAGSCRHTCCRGWEIDVDEESVRRYRSVGGAIGKRLRENLVTGADGTHFRLDAEERCPFLNREGLCDLILELGEDSLCQICRDHPRFRNFFTDHVEIGLGLVCEAAALQTVNREEPLRMTILEDDREREEVPEEEKALTGSCQALLALAQDRTLPLARRMEIIREAAGVPACPVTRETLERFLKLEVLDPAWPEWLRTLAGHLEEAWLPEAMEKPAEQLLCYLLCRHLPGTLEDGAYAERVLFCLLSLELICRVATVLPLEGKAALAEAARLFSGEIEYSDENIGCILDALSETLEDSFGE